MNHSRGEYILAVGEKIININVLITSREKDGLTELIETANRMRSCDCEDVRLGSF